ncbi:MAG: SUMF1/EgtB/PvdO family nonheme iron enzyme [Phycisphaerales bacterium]|nr:SUMF1/EgtB/PvdO family nonheme iron enzyme [Phycisphaerales bacterium]
MPTPVGAMFRVGAVLVIAGMLAAITGCDKPLMTTCLGPPGSRPATAGTTEKQPAPTSGLQPFDVATAPPTGPALPPAFAERVPGSTLTIDMIPIAGDADCAPFFVSVHEIPWDVYDIFVYRLDVRDDDAAHAGDDSITRPSKPYVAMDRGFGHAGFPAISMSGRNAQAFCAWLSAHTGRTYRLPTVDEWSLLCARSGVTADELEAHAWYSANSGRTTHPVGTKSPDDLGLYDLYGNASEWCTAADGSLVTMGGTYRDDAGQLTCAHAVAPSRAWNASDPQFPKSVWWLADAGFVGVRVVCEIEQQHSDEPN